MKEGNLNRQLEQLGSQRKVSVSAPKLREKKPNLAFKAPTYDFRDSRYLSTRQGGVYYPEVSGLFLIFLALTAKVLRGRTTIDTLSRFCDPVKNILSFCIFLQILPLIEDFNGVYSIDLKTLCKFILPPE